jgi:hypothetical protein
MRFKAFKLGKSKEEPRQDTSEAESTVTEQVSEMEEQVNNKTKELEATEQELKDLTDTVKDAEEDDKDTPQPHQPLSELTVEPGDELTDEDTDLDTALEEPGEGLKVVEVSAESGAEVTTEATAEVKPVDSAEAAAEAKPEEAPAVIGGDDSLASLFSDDEEEVNPLASLINSLPDVTPGELMEDLKEIQEILQEQRQG